MIRTAAPRVAGRWLRVACIGLLPVAALAAQSPPARPNAWRFTWTVTPSADGEPIRGGAMVLDVAIWKGAVRITAREGPLRALTGDDGAVLFPASDSTVAVIKPARREVLIAAAHDLTALMGGPGQALPIEVSDASSTTRARGSGAPLLRFSTRRIELTQRYAIQLTTSTVRRALRTEQVHDIDISRDIARLDNGFRVFAGEFARTLGLPRAVRTRLHALERSVPDGMPVRTTTVALTTSGTDTVRTVTRSVMSELRQEFVDTTGFVIPAGYRVTEMSRLLQRGRTP